MPQGDPSLLFQQHVHCPPQEFDETFKKGTKVSISGHVATPCCPLMPLLRVGLYSNPNDKNCKYPLQKAGWSTETDCVLFKLAESGVTSEIQGVNLFSGQLNCSDFCRASYKVQPSSLWRRKKKSSGAKSSSAHLWFGTKEIVVRSRSANKSDLVPCKQADTWDYLICSTLHILRKKEKNGTYCKARWVFQSEGGVALWPRMCPWRAAIGGWLHHIWHLKGCPSWKSHSIPKTGRYIIWIFRMHQKSLQPGLATLAVLTQYGVGIQHSRSVLLQRCTVPFAA